MAPKFDATRDGIGPGPLLPPGEFSEFDQSEAPHDIVRGFLVGESVRPVDPARMVPCEEVLPGAFVPLLIVPNMGVSGRWDYDHTRFQSNDPRLQDPDRRPLRYCYGQYLPRAVHARKNDNYDAVEIPEDPAAVFQAVLLGVAKYIPNRVIDLSSKQPVICPLTDSLRAEFHRNGWVGVQPRTEWKIGFYLARYILENGLGAVRETTEVAKFVYARDEQARKFASFGVVRKALEVVVDPIEPTYEVALKRGAIRRPEPTAARFVARYFDCRQPDYVSTIADALMAV